MGSAQDWADRFEADGNDDSPAWSQKMADSVAALTNGLFELVPAFAGAKFTFSTGAFKSGLEAVTASTSKSGSKFAAAWEAGITGSTMLRKS